MSKEILCEVNSRLKSIALVPCEISKQKYIFADFTGDREEELIIFVQNNQSKDLGILIWLPSTESYSIFGAGVVYDSDLLLDNLNWVSRFEVVPPGTYSSGDSHRADLQTNFHALKIAGNTIGSALIYFDGDNFNYFYQVSPVKKNVGQK